jgi:hypothetical protein
MQTKLISEAQHMVMSINAEIGKLEHVKHAIAAMDPVENEATSSTDPQNTHRKVPTLGTRKRSKMSPESRKKISDAAKKRWALVHSQVA